MNIHHTLARPVLATLAFFAFALSGSGNATTSLSFEGPLPPGLVATSYLQGTAVPNAARVTDQYLSTGLVISGAALVNLGVGHAPSGTNGLAGIDGNGNLDYDSPLTFSFFMPGNGGVAGTTDYFAYSADLGGGSGNILTISAYDLLGVLLGQVSFVETGTFTSPLVLSGFGQFHSITVDHTLFNTSSGGIGIDLVTYGDVTTSVPEPGTLTLLSLGLAGLGFARRKKQQTA